jgi:hypothetical protein
MSGSPHSQVKIFPFDQCLNDKSIADEWNAQGLAIVYRFPRRLIHGLPRNLTRSRAIGIMLQAGPHLAGTLRCPSRGRSIKLGAGEEVRVSC